VGASIAVRRFGGGMSMAVPSLRPCHVFFIFDPALLALQERLT